MKGQVIIKGEGVLPHAKSEYNGSYVLIKLYQP